MLTILSCVVNIVEVEKKSKLSHRLAEARRKYPMNVDLNGTSLLRKANFMMPGNRNA